MTEISKRLSVEGPDHDGDYEVSILESGDYIYTFITRAEADALIAALTLDVVRTEPETGGEGA